ncbi:hypothetical protein BOX15_Mlig013508g2 [Macrostomum lignano]|uniref:PKD domain-containing protein n=1 Tax=Macrostomum lignano TaxID=282301 RepID=A0A267D9Y1_9PLAT|nr:hypothetical protein BOX15_Mlig013508g2 [Macrostomum lignano]
MALEQLLQFLLLVLVACGNFVGFADGSPYPCKQLHTAGSAMREFRASPGVVAMATSDPTDNCLLACRQIDYSFALWNNLTCQCSNASVAALPDAAADYCVPGTCEVADWSETAACFINWTFVGTVFSTPVFKTVAMRLSGSPEDAITAGDTVDIEIDMNSGEATLLDHSEWADSQLAMRQRNQAGTETSVPVWENSLGQKALLHAEVQQPKFYDSPMSLTAVRRVQQRVSAAGSIEVSAGESTDGKATWGTEVTITAPFQMGSNMTARIDFANGRTVAIGGLNAAPVNFRQAESQQSYTADTRPAGLVLLNYDVSVPCTVTGVAFHANVSAGGSFDVQVLRPQCPDGSTYCYVSNACLAVGQSCGRQPSVRSFACIGGDRWSLQKRRCSNAAGPASQFPIFAGQLLSIKRVQLTVASAGFNSLQLNASQEQHLHLLPGDILAVSDPGQAVSVREQQPRPDYFVESSGIADNATSLAATAAPPSTLGLAKSVEFFGYRGGSVRASAVLGNNTCSGGSHLDCPDEYMYNVSVTFANHLADTAVLSRLVRVQVPILGVRIVTNATHYKTNAIVSFYVLQHQGSQPLYTWNFTDGTRTGPELQQQWNFTSPGPRTVQTESTNYISGNWSNILLIYVQNPVTTDKVYWNVSELLGLTSSGPVNGVATLFCDNSAEFLPTNASVILDFGDGTPASSGLLTWDPTTDREAFNHPYTKRGTYNATAIVENQVSRIELKQSVVVQEIIFEAQIETLSSTFAKSPLQTLAQFNVSVQFGSDFTADADFGDGHTVTVPDQGANRWFTLTHNFTVPGNYTVTVRLQNRVGSVTCSTEISIVIGDPREFLLALRDPSPLLLPGPTYQLPVPILLCRNRTVDTPQPLFDINLTLSLNNTAASMRTEHLIQCTAGTAAQDAACAAVNSEFRFCFALELTLGDPETIRALLTIPSRLSDQTSQLIFLLLPDLLATTIQANLHPDFALDSLKMSAAARQIFPMEKAVKFVLTIPFFGRSPVTCQWDFGDSSLATNSLAQVEHSYNRPGNYSISVNVSNAISWKVVTISITVQKSIFGIGLNAEESNGINAANPVLVNLGTPGTEACYQIDFSAWGSALSDGISYHVFGYRPFCESSGLFQMGMNSVWMTDLTDFYNRVYNASVHGQPTGGNGILSKSVAQEGAKNVTFFAANTVSRETHSWLMAVGKGRCVYPTSYLSRWTAPRYMRNTMIQLESNLVINCFSTSVTVRWTIEVYNATENSWKSYAPS